MASWPEILRWRRWVGTQRLFRDQDRKMRGSNQSVFIVWLAWEDMDGVQRLHDSLLRRRTAIRNHSSTLQWMKRCWRVVPHEDPELLSIDEFEVTYATLLYEMTICWEDDTSDIILAKMWQRDTSSFGNLDFDRFCCSLFRYVEMVRLIECRESREHVGTDDRIA
jgi:hypothetical protein